MSTSRITLALGAALLSSAALAMPRYSVAPVAPTSDETTFEVNGVINITSPGGNPASALTGTLEINTLTGMLEGGDLSFGAPAAGVPGGSLTFLGPQIGPGGPGSHVYGIELCAVSGCAGNWVLQIGLTAMNGGNPSLIGYTGGSIAEMSFVYSTIAEPWGDCVASGCGAITLGTGPGGGTSPGGSNPGGGSASAVPEPGSGALALLGLPLLALAARRRRPG